MADGTTTHLKPIVMRAEARAEGLKRYFTGKPCKNGHLSERRTNSLTCVACAAQTTKQWQRDNYEHFKELKRAWRSITANSDREKAQERLRRAKSPISNILRCKRWREENPLKAAASDRRWVEANRDKVRVKNQTRRARRKNADGKHTKDDIARLFVLQRGKCAYCSVSIKKLYHVDHIISLSRGGSNSPRNLALACAPCNQHKGASDPIIFAQRIGRLL